ncbi:50S ribosomal protein L3 [Patescibacteria group bacterium]|nr:50S ribosomal protein L3 [Patescibacteria group bacterium]
MINAIVGTKKGMAQAFLADGRRIPVTKIQAGPCLVTQVKSIEKDGYRAIQLGIGEKKAKQLTKPLAGHLKRATWPEPEKAKGEMPRVLREMRLESDQDTTLNVGDVITADQVLAAGDLVNVTGTSHGKGFTGVMKRWGFKGGPRTHGQSDRARAPGSIGQTTTPGRVFKGKKMAGHGGNLKVTVRNLLVLKTTKEGEVWVKGQVPGSRNGLVTIKKVGKAKKFEGLYEEKPVQKEEKKAKEKKESKKKEDKKQKK